LLRTPKGRKLLIPSRARDLLRFTGTAA
jgi:hypothetical protein